MLPIPFQRMLAHIQLSSVYLYLIACLVALSTPLQAQAYSCTAEGQAANCINIETSPWQYSWHSAIAALSGSSTFPSEEEAFQFGYDTLFPSLNACSLSVNNIPWNNNPPNYIYTDNWGVVQYMFKDLDGSYVSPARNPGGGGPTCYQKAVFGPDVHAAGYFRLYAARNIYCPGGYSAESQGNSILCYRMASDRDLAKSEGICNSCQQNESVKKVGNPVNITTGNKIEEEKDYTGVGPFPLRFERFYNSLQSYGFATSNWDATMGVSWTHTYSAHLQESVQGTNSEIVAYRPAGKHLVFDLINGVYQSDGDVADKLTRLEDSSGNLTGWKYTRSDDVIETYDSQGHLLSIASPSGMAQRLSYDAFGFLSSVTDTFGRTLSFTNDSQGRIIAMKDPTQGSYQYTYDNANRLTGVTYPDGTQHHYLYEDSNHRMALTGIVDENGNRFATWAYSQDMYGRVVSSQHAGGAEKVSITYNSNSSTATDALGQTKIYTYQTILGSDHVTKLVTQCPSCQTKVELFSYDANGYLTSHTDPNGNVTQYTYDSRGLQLSRTEAAGTPQARTITTTWHASLHLPVQITEPNRTTTYTYDTNGNLLTKTIGSGGQARSWTYTYNANGQVTSIDGPRTDVSDVTTYTYDSQGNLATMTDPLGHVTQVISYDANGRPLSIQDPNGLVTALTYDPRGRITSKIVGAETTNFSYDPVGNLVKVEMPDGAFLSYTYDAAHRLTGITDNLGDSVAYTLDSMSNITKVDIKDPTGNLAQTRSLVFNGLSQLVQAIGAQNQVTAFGYDGNGNQISVTDPLSHSSSSAFDALNRLAQVTDPANGLTKLAYDSSDNLISVTDPKGLTTTYGYDGLGNKVSVTSPDTGTTRMTYDSAGNLLEKTDARNIATSYVYDALNRPTSISFGTGNISFTYDAGTNGIGHLTGMTDPSGSSNWDYDAHGRVTRRSVAIGNISKTVSYAYDPQGRLVSMTYPSGSVINLSYAADKVTAVSLGNTSLLSNVTYSPLGKPTGWTWGNGVAFSRQFDTDGRLSNFTLGNGTRSIGYDAASRIVSLSDGTSTTNKTLGYDNLDRLTQFLTSTTSYGYAYDGDGNRTSATIGSNSYAYGYDSASNHLLSVSGPTAQANTYDTNGNLIGDGSKTYTFDNRNRLVAVTQHGSSVASYQYNGLGQRVMKTANSGYTLPGKLGQVLDRLQQQSPKAYAAINRALTGIETRRASSGQTDGKYFQPAMVETLFVYDEAGHLIGEYDSSGKVLSEHVYLGDVPVAVLVPSSTGGVTTYYVQSDQIGAPRVIKDASNATVWSWDGEPFGGSPASGSLTYNLRFPGQYYDAETGRHYNYLRDYDPMIGRYIKSDPIGLRGGINSYAYVNGNPLGSADPLGLMGQESGAVQGRSTSKILLPPVDDPCVMRWINENYGDVLGFITDIGNLQMYFPSANHEYKDSLKEGAQVVAEKTAVTKGPGIAGRALIRAIPANFAVGNVIGSGLATFGGLASGVVEIAGAFMTPFATMAMAQAREACSCQK